MVRVCARFLYLSQILAKVYTAALLLFLYIEPQIHYIKGYEVLLK